MDLKELLGKSIQELRLRLGLTQEKLSEELGISINQMQNIEQRRSLPSLRVLLKLHQKYGFSIDSALDAADQPSNHTIQELIYELQECSPEDLDEVAFIFRKILHFRKDR